jgi:Cu(I)/Ag(I) efflux system membrane fusion protein
MAAGAAAAQNPRSHTRLDPRGTRVTQSQAETLTLTLGAAEVRLLQTWVRTAGTIDKTGKVLTATVADADAPLVKVGQRVRAFPPSSKSSMYQAYVTRVTPQTSGVAVEATLAASGRANTTLYVMEIVVEQGPFLVVPNEAIIEEGDRRVVYVQQNGEYVPKDVRTGIQGELYTQVLEGLQPSTPVVTFGSFFIDAEHKLKGSGLDQ